MVRQPTADRFHSLRGSLTLSLPDSFNSFPAKAQRDAERNATVVWPAPRDARAANGEADGFV